MALSTENSGALLGLGSHDPSTVYATFLKSTFVESLGRNSVNGETVKISKKDATMLFPWGKARRATDEEISGVTEEVSVAAEESLEDEVSEEVTEADLTFEPEVADEENGASVENDAEGEAEVSAEPTDEQGKEA